MSHGCSFVFCHCNKTSEVMMRPCMVKPFIICGGGNLKKMLIQPALTATPKIHKKTTRPRKDNVSIMDKVICSNIWRTKFACRIARSLTQFLNLQNGKSFFSRQRTKALHCKSVQIIGNICKIPACPMRWTCAAEWLEVHEPRLENGLCHLL